MRTDLKYILLLLIAWSFSLKAEDISFTATVNKNPVAEDEVFQLNYTINGEGRNFRAPNFTGFTVVSGPNQSSSFSFRNGISSQTFTISYMLKAGRKGSYTIPGAAISVGNSKLTSNPINMRIIEPSEAQKRQREEQDRQEQQLGKQANDIIQNNLYIRVNAAKTSAYVGDQVMVSYKLYINDDLNLVSLNLSKTPVFTGFWAQDFDEKEFKWEREVINGVAFKTATIKRVVLIPQQSGKLVVEPMEFESVVRLRTQSNQRPRSMWDEFFGRSSFRDFEHVVKSKPVDIAVKALPDGAPADFEGAVGDFRISAWADKTKTVTNDPVTFRIKIEGKGNMKLLGPLKLQLPSGLESYDPKSIDNVSVTPGSISGDMIFEYLVLPRTPGEYKIPPVAFSYFDLEKKTYVTLSTQELELKVEQGSGDEASASGVNKEELKYLGKDIRFIKTSTEILPKARKSFFGTSLFYLSLLLPLLLFLLLILFRRRKNEENRNVAGLKNKRATKIARKRLSRSKQHLVKKDKDKFYEEVSQGLWAYLSEKLNIAFSELTKDNARETLARNGAGAADIEKLMEVLEKAELARFSPMEDESGMGRIYEDATDVIVKIEGALR